MFSVFTYTHMYNSTIGYYFKLDYHLGNSKYDYYFCPFWGRKVMLTIILINTMIFTMEDKMLDEIQCYRL